MKIVWIKSGIEIHNMVSGFFAIISPLKENKRTNVVKSAIMLIGVRQCKNFSLNHSCPLDFIINLRDKYPATNGRAT